MRPETPKRSRKRHPYFTFVWMFAFGVFFAWICIDDLRLGYVDVGSRYTSRIVYRHADPFTFWFHITWVALISIGFFFVSAIVLRDCRARRGQEQESRVFCSNCGREFTGTSSGACPECGTPMD